jgi:hypothetical protein
MPMCQRLIGFLCATAFALAVTGCGDHSPPPGAPLAKPQPTHGKITFPDGSPLHGGMITFKPKEVETGSKIRYDATSLVDAKGEYKLGMNGDGAGAPTGDYVVIIEPRDYQELPGSNSRRIPQKYRSAGSSTLTRTVKDGDNTFDFVLQ